ncbi:MAG: glycosyltransferase [Planctomycetota bacterium]
MKILVDLQACQSGSRLGGIGRYSMDLAKAMVRVAPEHDFSFLLNSLFPDHQQAIKAEFDGLVGPESFHVFRAIGPTRSAEKSNAGRRAVSELLRENVIRDMNPDVIHVASLVEGWGDDVVVSMNAPDLNEKTAITWYDLIPYVQPEMYLNQAAVAEQYYGRVDEAKRAVCYLAISQHTANELVRELEVDPLRVTNIQAGVCSRFTPALENDSSWIELSRRHSISKSYVIYTASFDTRKNQKGLIRAYSLLPKELRDNYQLVIVGNAWEGVHRELSALARSCGLDENDLVVTGHVTNDELLALYRNAYLFVFPSFFEGFGLPALEAMACGTPAIGSGCTSIPEVIGREDALFDPTSDESIAAKIGEVLENADFHRELQEHGLQHAAQFTWERAARSAVDAFERLHQERKQIVAGRIPKFVNREASYTQLVKDVAQVCSQKSLSNHEIDCIAGCIEENERVVTEALSLQEQIDSVKGRNAPSASGNRVGWVTTWGTRCGIASYAEYLVKVTAESPVVILAESQSAAKPSKLPVVPCWNAGVDDLTRLAAEVERYELDTLVIQFNYGFFDFSALTDFIAKQNVANRQVVIVLHSTQDPPPKYKKQLIELRGALGMCARVLVHTRADVARLQEIDLFANVSIVPHAVPHAIQKPTKQSRDSEFTIATYGFFLEHKGFLEVLEAFEQLAQNDPSLRLRMVNASYSEPASAHLIQQAENFRQSKELENKVEIITDYLEDQESLDLLSSSDLIVFPYQQTGESSSAAVRFGLASQVPVAVTPLPIFDDVSQVVAQLPGCDVISIRDGICNLVELIRKGGDAHLAKLQANAARWRSAHDVRHAANQLAQIIETPRARVA